MKEFKVKFLHHASSGSVPYSMTIDATNAADAARQAQEMFVFEAMETGTEGFELYESVLVCKMTDGQKCVDVSDAKYFTFC